jgi:hypothetical protein
MKKPLEFDLLDDVEEIDLSERAMYKRAFKKIYNKEDKLKDDIDDDIEILENEDSSIIQFEDEEFNIDTEDM